MSSGSILGNYLGGVNGQIKLDSITNFSHLSTEIQQHLVKVYSTLVMLIAFSAIGCLTAIQYNIGSGLAAFFTFATLIYLTLFSQYEPYKSQNTRLAVVCAFGFFEGASLANLVNYTLEVNPHILTIAFFATVTIFACFSGAALLSKRREYLYLGGILSSATSMLILMSFFNIFFRTSFVPWLHLYAGLLLFCGYIIYDTQVIIERASLGITGQDYVAHALELFIDLVAIFVRIVIILLKKDEDKKKRR
jgi:FtsH-binding integral membrane protein